MTRLRPSPNFNERDGVAVDMLVIHYTGMESCEAALERLCDPAAEVSAHYLIDEAGEIFQLVAEDKRAWHAGVSSWRGEANINSRSIGIELVNPGHEFGYQAFPDAQMVSLIELSVGILSRHDIPDRNVVGHSDVAPARKEDPGELFDWARMADAGIGLWPGPHPDPIDETEAGQALSDIGYDVSDISAAVKAFQRHFRQHTVDGVLDEETRCSIAAVRTSI